MGFDSPPPPLPAGHRYSSQRCLLLDGGLGLARAGGAKLFANAARTETGPAENLASNLAKACGESFSPETQVLMADGSTKPLDQVKVGDRVEATDPATGKTSAQTVTKVWVNRDTDLMDVTITAGGVASVIHATQHHLFWNATRHKWIEAEQLNAGDQLRTDNGQLAVVARTTIVPGAADMWDLTITTTHDFYVVARDASVLVHNCSGTRRPAVRPEKPTDPPSWVKPGGHYGETTDPNPASAAARIMNEKYPDGWPTPRKGAGSEYSQTQKWLSRYFSWS